MHFDESELFDATIIIIAIALIFSRLSYVLLVAFAEYKFMIWQWLNLWGKPGIWMTGLIVAGGAAAYYQAKIRKWDMYLLTDVLCPALILFQAFMAFGQFLNGNGYGIVANNIFGLRFGEMLDKHIPVQLYEAIIYGLIFVLLLWAEGKYRTFTWYKGVKSEANSGFITASYLCLYGLSGLILFLFKNPLVVWWGVRFDLLFILSYIAAGGILLYRRAGNNITRSNGQWLWKWQEKRGGRFSTHGDRKNVGGAADEPRWGGDIFE